MASTVNTNTPSLQANLYANIKSKNAEKLLAMLSSGSKLEDAANDAAGLSIADKMSAQVRGLGQAVQNSNESIGLIQTADGAMSGINDNLERIRTLTLQASNDTLSSSDRDIIQKEIDALMESTNDIATTTKYNGINLLDGSGGSGGDGTFVTQSGADAGDNQSVQIADARTSSLVGTIDVTTASGRSSALDALDNALNSVNGIRADLGAAQNALVSNVNNISITQNNTAAAESQIRDVDFAEVSKNFSQANIMSQIGSFAQAQSNNLSSSRVAGLLG